MKTIKAPMQTVDMATGEVTEGEASWGLLPPPAGCCQTCGAAHPPEIPHHVGSLYYSYTFHAEHGRLPTWRDAMAHCSPEVKARVTEMLTDWRIDLDSSDTSKNES